jgi:acyl-coenzyme A synthetase/AMP-(fatty) acid ligase
VINSEKWLHLSGTIYFLLFTFYFLLMEDLAPRLDRFQSYEEALSGFQLSVPDQFNIAAAIRDRHPDAVTRIALLETMRGGANTYTLGGLDYLSDKFANALVRCGLKEGDVVATHLAQPAQVAIAGLAAFKLGAVLALIPATWDLDSIKKALSVVKAGAIIAARNTCDSVSVEARFVVDTESGIEDTGSHRHFWRETYTASSFFESVKTCAGDPAIITFAKKTDGEIKIIAHTHASLLAQLPAFEMFCDLRPWDMHALMLGPDWSEGAIFLGLVLPAWLYGIAIETGSRHVAHSPGVCLLPEAGFIAATCARWFAQSADSSGRIAPGRRIEIVDERGNALARGALGRLAISPEDPAWPLDYPTSPLNTRVVSKPWITDHTGYIDAEGHLRLLRKQ